jgi:hypothetical protein
MAAIKIFFNPIGKVKKAIMKENNRKGNVDAKLELVIIR